MKRYRKGLLPLSADPITFGHLHLIQKATALCQEVLVWVSNNDQKRGAYVFTEQERFALAKRAIEHYCFGQVNVCNSSDLLVDVYLQQGCDVLIRGVRNECDRAYEEQQLGYHALIYPPITQSIEYLAADDEHRQTASSLVKAFMSHQVDVSQFVPRYVQAALREKLHQQRVIGITGGIAVGKSFIARELVTRLPAITGRTVTHIAIDHLVREVYDEVSPAGSHIRQALAFEYGSDVLLSGGARVDRDRLRTQMFAGEAASQKRERLHQLISPQVERLFRNAMRSAGELVLIEWSQLAEMDMASLCDGNAIVVASSEQRTFARNRDVPPAQYAACTTHQWPADKQYEFLHQQAEENRHGSVIQYENRSGGSLDALIAFIDTLPNPT